MGELILLRHGETAWSRSGQHAGRTDLPMTDAGVAAARALAPALARRHLVAAFSSPLSRAMRTAELALGLEPSAGQLFGHPHPGTLSMLGIENEQPVICAWNILEPSGP